MSFFIHHSIGNSVNRRYTQADLVVAVLQQRGSATTDLLEELGIKCPSAVIHTLREQGVPINSKLIWEHTEKCLFAKKQAEYSLGLILKQQGDN
jgi:hypothetical protein